MRSKTLDAARYEEPSISLPLSSLSSSSSGQRSTVVKLLSGTSELNVRAGLPLELDVAPDLDNQLSMICRGFVPDPAAEFDPDDQFSAISNTEGEPSPGA